VAPATASSAAVPIPADALVEGEPGKGVLSKDEQESRTRMMAVSGLTGMPTPDMTQQEREEFKSGKQAGTIAGARDAALMSVAGPVASKVSAGVDAALAPKPVTQTVGTGILDSAGKEIMKDVTTLGPSVAKVFIQNPTVQKLALKGAGLLGLGWLMKMGREF
jgi:hypothetical protein